MGDSITKKGVKYRPLFFIVHLQSREHHLLFNVMTKEFIALTEDEYKEYQCPKIHSFISDYLVKHLFLVEDDIDDHLLVESIRDLAISLKKASWNGEYSSFQVFTTTACNAHCHYCFEKAIPILSMSSKVAHDVSDFIMSKHNKKGIYIRWFGGEPLCNPNAIDIISERLSEQEVPFYSAIYTNGLLFSHDLISKAVFKWNLKTAQITIDGTKNTYNKIKATASTNNPFETVINNIDNLIDAEIHVSIRTHLTEDNEADVERLITLLSDRYKYSPFMRVYVNRLFSEQRINKHCDGNSNIEQTHLRLCERIIELFPNTHAEHLRTEIRTFRCFGDSYESASILPDGRLLPCTHYDTKSITYGSIYDKKAEKPDLWYRYYPHKQQCNSCFYYPDCLQLIACPESPPYCNDWRLKTRLMRIQRQMQNDWRDYSIKNHVYE